MPSINTLQINGVVRTSEPVWSNIERLTEACTSWFTYNVHTGLYSWKINQADSVVVGGALSEADIIGSIQISGSDLTNLYNAVEMEYPNTDIRDQPHYTKLELSPAARNLYEPDNTLQLTSEFINNQPQAEYSAIVNLKTSRLDRTVVFNCDYTKINLLAGDIISITSDTYAWTAKQFRIMRVREIEGDDGSLRLEFSCSEYSDSIYTNDLSEFLVGAPPGIRSLGSIGVPGTPTIAVANINSLPTQLVTSTVPAGIVDRMQFWAGNVLITGSVGNTDFNLVGTVASTDAASFTQNSNVVFSTTSLQDGTWAWKTRGVNANGTGPYSDISGNVLYVRGQAPDLIKQGTPTVNSSGNAVVAVITMDNAADFNVDGIYYAGNTTYQSLINTSDVTMFGVNGNVANVAATIPPGQNNITVDITSQAAVVKSFVRVITGNVNDTLGLATYIAKAEWDQAAYTANGFSGLNWSNWVLLSRYKDEQNYLTGNVLISTSGVFPYTVSPTGNTEIYALGFSSTQVPNTADFTTQVDPISGITGALYTREFVGNTVVIDYSSGSATAQYPGKTGTFSLASATGRLFNKIRIDK